MKKIKYYFPLLALVLLTGTSKAGTIVIRPNTDAVINSSNPGTNYGNDTRFISSATVSGSNVYLRSLINFDLSGVPKGAVVSSASITLSDIGHSGTNASYLSRIITAWTESQVTWTNQPATTTTNRAPLPSSSASQVTIDITNMINDMLDDPSNSFGLMLSLQSETPTAYMSFASSDYTTDTTKRPFISINYSFAYSLYSSVGNGHEYLQKIVPLFDTTDYPLSGTHDAQKISESFTFLDGFGRPVQSIGVHGSPQGKDVVQLCAYDAAGRTLYKYLPYTVKTSVEGVQYFTNAFTDQSNFYSAGTGGVSPSSYAYTTFMFDNSPLNRVVSQMEPGSDVYSHPSTFNTKPISSLVTMYLVNGTMASSIEGGGTSTTNYVVRTTTDPDGRVAKEYVIGGQTIVKEISGSPAIQTTYVYDKMHRLRYIVSPEETKLNPSFLTPKSSAVKNYCYYYDYDARGRKILEQKPGADSIYYVYDRRDRMVLSQDGNQRQSQQWTFIKYDIYDRVAYTGIFTNSNTRSVLQGYYDTAKYLYEDRDTTKAMGYTNRTYPTTTITKYLSASFYDDYSGLPSAYGYSIAGVTGFTSTDFNGFTTAKSNRTKGKATWGKTAMLDSITGMNTWMTSAVYYDYKGRVIQSINDNFAAGKDRVSNKYNDHNGWLLATVQEHSDNFASAVKIGQRYTYDHRGSVVRQYHQIAGQTEVLVTELAYNELGEVVQKKMGYAGNGNFLQMVDYKFNLRGQLLTINDGSPSTYQNDLFAMKLHYTDPIEGMPDCAAQYNGNLSAVEWKYNKDSLRYCSYLYDYRNQLIKANYEQYFPVTGMYDLYGSGANNTIQYDCNGNRLNLKRNDKTGALLHNLAYRYIGNELTELGLNGTTTGATQYTYDRNGNMTLDNHDVSNIDTIAYNMLNLPKKISRGTDYVKFVYSAGGAKMFMEDKTGASTIRTYYLGNFQYSGPTGSVALNFINTSFGRIVPVSGGGYQYEYYLTDHQGNVRVRFRNNNGTVKLLERDDYDALGYIMNQTIYEGSNQYLYNGKERYKGKSVDWYDYGARYYDPVIGRWHTQDPETQYASPYIGIGNNPVNLIDRWGMDANYWAETQAIMMGTWPGSYAGSGFNFGEDYGSYTIGGQTVSHEEYDAYNASGYDAKYGSSGASIWMWEQQNGTTAFGYGIYFNSTGYTMVDNYSHTSYSTTYQSGKSYDLTISSAGITEKTSYTVVTIYMVEEASDFLNPQFLALAKPSPMLMDAKLTFNGSALSWVNIYSDNSTKIAYCWTAKSGPYGNGHLPNGLYNGDNLRMRTDNDRMLRDGVEFSLDLNPTFDTDRDDLRVHPMAGDGTLRMHWTYRKFLCFDRILIIVLIIIYIEKII